MTKPGTLGKATATFLLLALATAVAVVEGSGQWCVVRLEATTQQLQRALDYACGIGGADCSPIQANGLCFLPNTIQAHASYAFNSYFQRKARSPGSCDFSGTANVAQTDPSYGSCVYPSSLSTAGGSTTPSVTPTATTPTTTATANPLMPPPPLTTIFSPPYTGMSPPGTSFPPDSSAAPHRIIMSRMSMLVVHFSFLLAI